MSSDESDDNESSLEKSSFDEKKRVIEENRKENSVYKGLKDNEIGVQVKIKEHTFELK